MTVPDPDEPDGRAGAQHRGETGPTDATDVRFAEIVAGWRSAPDAPSWPSEDEATGGDAAGGDAAALGDDAALGDHAALGDDDHFVPPEPPPLPALQPRTIGGLLVLAVGVLLLLAPGVLGVAERLATPLGLLTLTGGFVWLALGLRSGPPPNSGWDDGAQL
ncbi:MAG: hypothetical protein H0W37_04845 [Pseudonocardiales bacterium]|nr:hypothetical protein [Pseudonocardiales bacterium]